MVSGQLGILQEPESEEVVCLDRYRFLMDFDRLLLGMS
jgi:hypothetical protein